MSELKVISIIYNIMIYFENIPFIFVLQNITSVLQNFLFQEINVFDFIINL